MELARGILVYGSLLAGGTALIQAARVALRTRRLIRDGTRTEGRILGYTQKKEDEIVSDSSAGSGMRTEQVTAYYPQVRFTTPDGSAVIFESKDRMPNRGIGIAVRVLYDPADPLASAQIEGSLNQWTPVILASLLAAALLGGGVLMWTSGVG